MGKKVKEYKSGDFIFAKVKGYPAWPARVQKMNGKKYFVYFYGTGETANLPPNMIFDYAENKDKFLNKTVKRKDFNDGVRQIEHDFANNVPLEQVIGTIPEEPSEPANGVNESTANENADDSAIADTTATDDTADETGNMTQNDTAVEDSDETGALVIDEGKQLKGRKSTAKTQVKETPKAKEPKTPRGRKKEEAKETKDDEEEKKEEEIVSRSGRKIRPKRYIDEQTEENTTLPSPAPKKARRGASPASDKDKEKDKTEIAKDKSEKNVKQYNAVSQSELEELKEPFTSEDSEKENILIAYVPSGQYIGIKLFQSRPTTFKNETARLQWDKQAAANAITLKMQLEKGQITPQSIAAQLVMDLSLTDEEKATLDKEREIEEKKIRVQFLKTEMKLIELDAKIKTCLSLEKADTELCLKLLDELMELDIKPLMLLKHPTCLETVKRMRAYVGNTPSWDLSESAALVFSKQAHKIRKQADSLYKNMKELFTTPEGLSFYEYFSERVLLFKKATAKLSADELLEMVHEPLELSLPSAHTMKAAIEAANKEEPLEEEEKEPVVKKKSPGKAKKAASTPSRPPLKRQSSRRLQQEEKEKEKESNKEKEQSEEQMEIDNSDKSEFTDKSDNSKDKADKDTTQENSNDKETDGPNTDKESESTAIEMKDAEPESSKDDDNTKDNKKTTKDKGKDEKSGKDKESNGKSSKDNEKSTKDKESSKNSKDKDEAKIANESGDAKEDKIEEEKEKEKEIDEPRAKRSRDNKKTEPLTPKSPAKRKSKS